MVTRNCITTVIRLQNIYTGCWARGPYIRTRQIVHINMCPETFHLLCYIWKMHDGLSSHFSRAVRGVLSNSYHDRWIGTGGPTAWPPCSTPYLNPLDFYLWGHLNTLCMQLLLTTKEHVTIVLWMPVRLPATTPPSLNGCGGPDETRRGVH
jgi:hypothetical protein